MKRSILAGLLIVWVAPVGLLAAEDSPGGTAAPGEASSAPAASEAPAPEPIQAPDLVPAVNALQRAWNEPAESLVRRVEVTRRAALEVGAWNFDPAARALIQGIREGQQTDRAEGAVRLAPDLPAAHFALARARWLDGEDPMSAVRAVVAGLQAIPRHPEASLWFAGSALTMLSAALVGAGMLLIGLAALGVARAAAHDIAHLWPFGVSAPAFARFAALGALLLAPLALGEGVLGLFLALLAIGLLYGTAGRRFALTLAAVGVVAGLYPLPRFAGAALDAYPSDPVLSAAHSTMSGLASPVDLARLEHAAEADSLAVRALAVYARQTGNLGRADALYQRLLDADGSDLTTLNNAANVRLDLGHVGKALELYDRALDLETSPVVLFNLSQTYGRSFQVDDLNRTLAEAQRADGPLVADFTALQRTKNEGFVVDMPVPVTTLWKRVFERPQAGAAVAAEFRAPLAPGRLGHDRDALLVVLGVILALGWLAGSQFSGSAGCARCGQRLCPRCDGTGESAEMCESCTRLYYRPEKTDRALRAGRIESLRHREQNLRRLRGLLALVFPGAAGWLAARPVRGYIGAFAFALSAACAYWWRGVVPDPLVAGLAGPMTFLGIASVCMLFYLATVATSRVADEA